MSEDRTRGIVSSIDRRRATVRWPLRLTQGVLLLATVVVGLGPILWTLKGALSPTQDLLREPLRLWPSSVQWENLATAWTDLRVGHYLLNTVVLVAGSWLVQIVVAATGAYALSVLRPRFGTLVYGAVLATLFVPGTVSLVGLYLTVLDLSLTDQPWAVWLPAGAHAFNVLIMKQFFDGLPRELFQAAQVDGAGPIRLFWQIVMPMSRPILAVVSLLVVMDAWKEFLWPMVAISDADAQPLAVALPRLAETAEQNTVIAGMLVAIVPPLLLFLVFQRHIVRGISFTGLKG
ncbi:multiple sugar transport system permease protein [Thermocatellispora tengchongensis]|uniref:Multiple sugar transport system permease protein n=1 Tax=Thermocatellispora tengchongensis TaxID=1073253 RepID=A0A840PR15_9ACTN|nr:carbohydrate ABC transporter permease [Thermocatellispora tengchongensis]MBB5140230.1 multiple sugar transport system permease protein [Thermocatellispora tengchongensis]